MTTTPVLYVIACGAPPAQDRPGLPDYVEGCQAIGWDVCVVPTTYGRRFVDADLLAQLTGHPLRSDYKLPGEDDVLPPADALVVAPATFNTVNKLAAGIADTLALGLLNEAIGARVPVVVAVCTNKPLADHPAFGRSVELLREAGVRFVPDATDLDEIATSPAGLPFPWAGLLDEVRRLHEDLTTGPLSNVSGHRTGGGPSDEHPAEQ